MQVWLNCTLYNKPNHPVRIAGDALSDLFERSWLESGIESAWRDFELRYGSGAAAAAAAPASRRSSQGGLGADMKVGDEGVQTHQNGKFEMPQLTMIPCRCRVSQSHSQRMTCCRWTTAEPRRPQRLKGSLRRGQRSYRCCSASQLRSPRWVSPMTRHLNSWSEGSWLSSSRCSRQTTCRLVVDM